MGDFWTFTTIVKKIFDFSGTGARIRLVMRKVKYLTLHEYLDRTGTNQTQLIELVEATTGKRMSHALLSMILRGSRRCSRMNAFAIHVATGVPMEGLTQWPPLSRLDQFSGSRPKRPRGSLRENENGA